MEEAVRRKNGENLNFSHTPSVKNNGRNGESSKNPVTFCTERYTKKKNGVNSTATKTGRP
jgi:hypothetical protein